MNDLEKTAARIEIKDSIESRINGSKVSLAGGLVRIQIPINSHFYLEGVNGTNYLTDALYLPFLYQLQSVMLNTYLLMAKDLPLTWIKGKGIGTLALSDIDPKIGTMQTVIEITDAKGLRAFLDEQLTMIQSAVLPLAQAYADFKRLDQWINRNYYAGIAQYFDQTYQVAGVLCAYLTDNPKTSQILDYHASTARESFEHLMIKQTRYLIENHNPSELITQYKNIAKNGQGISTHKSKWL
jgi:hypothetical protein